MSESATEIGALALAYGNAAGSDLGDLIAQDVWEVLFDRGLLRNVEVGQTGEFDTVVTAEGTERLAALLAGASATGEP